MKENDFKLTEGKFKFRLDIRKKSLVSILRNYEGDEAGIDKL